MSNKHEITAIVMSLCINGLGVVRSLGRHGVPVIGLSDGKLLPGKHSRYVRDIWYYGGGESEMVDLLIRRGMEFSERPVLYPITDVGVRCVADRIDEVLQFYRVGLPDSQLVESTMSKRGISNWLTKLNLSAPQTFFLDDANQILDVAGEVDYPCIIKPEFRSAEFAQAAGQKAYRAENAEGLIAFYRSFCHVDPRAVVQQWIPGGDEDIYFCLQYYNSKSISLGSFTGRKIRQWPSLCGGTASCEPVDCPEIEKLSTQFFSELKFRGLCSMEFKRNPKTGEFLIVEPTVGRTDWQSDVANANGLPIPYIAYCDLTEQKVPLFIPTRRQLRWVRWSADRRAAQFYIDRGELTFLRWISSILGPIRWSVWSFDDPLPYLKIISRKISGKLNRIFSNVK
ncbi:MAG: hypothetical protein JRG71_00705 [Deltaproteobacteria bacterium]|nr:hypothetical protein [Deltaproteobacteria bacterium]